jgi:hypothetical protein
MRRERNEDTPKAGLFPCFSPASVQQPRRSGQRAVLPRAEDVQDSQCTLCTIIALLVGFCLQHRKGNGHPCTGLTVKETTLAVLSCNHAKEPRALCHTRTVNTVHLPSPRAVGKSFPGLHGVASPTVGFLFAILISAESHFKMEGASTMVDSHGSSLRLDEPPNARALGVQHAIPVLAHPHTRCKSWSHNSSKTSLLMRSTHDDSEQVPHCHTASCWVD